MANSSYKDYLESRASDNTKAPLPGTLKLVTPPAVELFDLTFLKMYLRVDGSEEDSLIESIQKMRRSEAEELLNMGLLPQTYEEKIYSFPAYARLNPDRAIVLKKGPLISVSSITYFDKDNIEQTVSADQYSVLDSDRGLPVIAPLAGNSWPETTSRIDSVKITYQVGFATPSDIPDGIKSAILLMIADLYDNRTDSARGIPTASVKTLMQYRLQSFR